MDERLRRLAEQRHASKATFDQHDAELRAAVRDARTAGMGVTDIARHIGMDRETVYRYLRGQT